MLFTNDITGADGHITEIVVTSATNTLWFLDTYSLKVDTGGNEWEHYQRVDIAYIGTIIQSRLYKPK